MGLNGSKWAKLSHCQSCPFFRSIAHPPPFSSILLYTISYLFVLVIVCKVICFNLLAFYYEVHRTAFFITIFVPGRENVFHQKYQFYFIFFHTTTFKYWQFAHKSNLDERYVTPKLSKWFWLIIIFRWQTRTRWKLYIFVAYDLQIRNTWYLK